MKLIDFLNEEITVDISGNISDDWIIAFVGPCKLTARGEEKFAPIMNKQVRLFNVDGGYVQAEIELLNENEDKLAMELFYYAAGYCTSLTYSSSFLRIFERSLKK